MGIHPSAHPSYKLPHALQAAMPCSAYFFCLALTNSVLPALITVRILALYARHVQQEGFKLTLKSSSGALLAPSFPTWHSRLDSLVSRCKFHRVRVQLMLILLICSVRIIFYLVRIIVTPTYQSSTAVGCRFDVAEGIVLVILPSCFLAVLGPVVLRLLKRPDAIGLRNELFLQASKKLHVD